MSAAILTLIIGGVWLLAALAAIGIVRGGLR